MQIARLLLFTSVLGLLTHAHFAQSVPATINYQGRLTDNTPVPAPINATVNMTFEIWDVPSGGTVGVNRLWLEPASGSTPIPVTTGIFNVLLGASAGGSSVPIPASVFTGPARYLQIIVNGETLTPRQTISATGYANQAQNAALAANATQAVSATTATNATQLGGVAAASWQRALSPAGCAAGTFYNSIDPTGTAGCATVQSTITPPLSLTGAITAPGGLFSGVNSGSGSGVYGENSTTSSQAFGLHGRLTHSLVGSNSAGVRGEYLGSTGGRYGVWGSALGSGDGVYGSSVNGNGIHGSASTGIGVYGQASNPTGTNYGVYGVSVSSSGYGVYGTSYDNAGVQGTGSSTTGVNYGVFGLSNSTAGYGVYGRNADNIGVLGEGTATTGINFGVYGRTLSSAGRAVYGSADSATGTTYGIYGIALSASGYAGYFSGDTHVNGTLSKSAGSFKIDHPLDPENKYLYHSFVESPDMMNIYNGNIVTDGKGEAIVTMPEWFEALNKEFRYQLTCIGGFSPVYIAKKLKDNRFTIAGGAPGMEVSWTITGIRKDAYAEKHRIPVEQTKPANELGSYLHPRDFDQPEEKGVEWSTDPEHMQRMKTEREQPKTPTKPDVTSVP